MLFCFHFSCCRRKLNAINQIPGFIYLTSFIVWDGGRCCPGCQVIGLLSNWTKTTKRLMFGTNIGGFFCFFKIPPSLFCVYSSNQSIYIYKNVYTHTHANTSTANFKTARVRRSVSTLLFGCVQCDGFTL